MIVLEPGQRVVSQFSCGAASACATKIAIERYGDAVHVLNAFLASEDADNRRFLADCERWFGRSSVVVRDQKYGASAINVLRKRRFIVNRNGAPCSKALKRDVLAAYNLPTDLLVIGFTSDPRDEDRLGRYIDANPGVHVWAPLIEAGLSKRDCYAHLTAAGIELPRMYRLGYRNANCPGCPKGGMGYWNRIRIDFPGVFEDMASLQDELGPGSYFFRDRATGERISLRMLPSDAGRFDEEKPFECGAVCEWPEGEVSP
jgi:hypothetical protein